MGFGGCVGFRWEKRSEQAKSDVGGFVLEALAVVGRSYTFWVWRLVFCVGSVVLGWRVRSRLEDLGRE